MSRRGIAGKWQYRAMPILLAAALLGACRQSSTLAQVTPSIRMGTDSASAPLAGDLLSAYESQLVDSLLTLDTNSRGALLAALESGEIDAALLFHPLDRSELFSTPIGYTPLYILAPSNVQVSNISREDLKAVFAGQIVSWNELGGPDIPIQTVTEIKGSSERLAFESLVMGEEPFTSAARISTGSRQAIELVSANAGAIGYGIEGDLPENAIALAVDGVPATLKEARNHRYSLISAIIFVSTREPDGQLRAFLDWIVSEEGQQIAQRHMLRLSD